MLVLIIYAQRRLQPLAHQEMRSHVILEAAMILLCIASPKDLLTMDVMLHRVRIQVCVMGFLFNIYTGIVIHVDLLVVLQAKRQDQQPQPQYL